MTIAAGFRAHGGVILAADTQETIPDYLKTYNSKIFVCQIYDKFRFALTGAGGADMIDMIYQTLMDKFIESKEWNYSSAEKVIRDVVYETEIKYVVPYPAQERQYFHLLIALQVKGQNVRLLKAIGGVVRRVEDFTCVGDVALAHYAAANIEFSAMPVCFSRSFAIYMIRLVKSYSPNCGKHTDVLVFYDDWDAELLKQEFIQAEELQISMIAALTHKLTVNSFAHRAATPSLQKEWEHLKKHITDYRKWEKKRSNDHCKLPDQFITPDRSLLVGKDGLVESKFAQQARSKKKSPTSLMFLG